MSTRRTAHDAYGLCSLIVVASAILADGFTLNANAAGPSARAGSATAADAAAVVVKRVKYQKSVSDPCTGSSPYCQLLVEQGLPQNWRLDVSHVSCLTQSAGVPIYLEAYTAGFPVAFFSPRETIPGVEIVNSLTRFSVPENAGFALTLYSENDASAITCKVAGELVRLKQ